MRSFFAQPWVRSAMKQHVEYYAKQKCGGQSMAGLAGAERNSIFDSPVYWGVVALLAGAMVGSLME